MASFREFLKKSIENHHLGHSYLLVAKQELSFQERRQISLEILGVQGKSEKELNWVIELEAKYVRQDEKGIISRKTVNEILKFCQLQPIASNYKLIFLENAHLMTQEAANHLLKMMEEPPAYLVFLLTTSQPERLPETVKSRCIVFSEQKKNAKRGNDFTEIDKLIKKKLPEKFAFAQALAEKEREKIGRFFDQLLVYLIKKKKKSGTIEKTSFLREIARSKRLIETTNVNPRLMIERIFIKMETKAKKER